jgi:glycosyltransferase involved in cell wall biosynthesis
VDELAVLHISQTDNLGGSGRSAYKIHAGLRDLGVKSKMVVSIKDTTDPDVAPISRGLLKLSDKIFTKLTDAIALQYLFLPSSFSLLGHPWYRDANVIQLYNTHGGYFSHTALPWLARGRTVVWRLSDLWPLTGHCTFPGACEGWRSGCNPCPHLDYFPAIRFDTAAMLFRIKKRVYKRARLHIVAPSSWTLKTAQESPMLGDFPIHYIPNGINANLYHPQLQSEARASLGVPAGKKALLFAAQRLPNNPRKGGEFFLQAVQRLGRRDDVMVMLVGEGADEWGRELSCPVWRHERVFDEARMAMIYNAADVFVHPATGDNLPNTILEAMSCGLPTVAFDAGGIKDAVRHLDTGYLSAPGDVGSLTEGLMWALSLSDRPAVARRCRAAILDRFTFEKQALGFKTLYESLSNRGH